MRIFVTGGTGFIGKPLARALRARGHRIFVTKRRLREIPALKKELLEFKPHAVIHLAWEGIPNLGQKLSEKNLRQSLAFLACTSKANAPKVVISGSCWQHKKETHSREHAHFVKAKNMLEKQGRALVEKNGGIFIWTYPFFVYGPGKRSDSLIPHLINLASAGRKPLPKNLDTFHDYVFIDDVVHAFVSLVEKGTSSGSYDIGSGKLSRTGAIAVEIARAYHCQAPALKRIRARGLKANNQPLTRDTEWKPRVSLSEGLKKTIESFR